MSRTSSCALNPNGKVDASVSWLRKRKEVEVVRCQDFDVTLSFEGLQVLNQSGGALGLGVDLGG